MESNEIVLKFIAFLAETNAAFRQVHVFAEKCSVFKSITTAVIPWSAQQTCDHANNGVTIAIDLSAELLKPPDAEKRAIGISLLLLHTHTSWRAEAEIGWTGTEIGWDSFDSKEIDAPSIEEIMNKVSPLVEWLRVRFREEVEKLQLSA